MPADTLSASNLLEYNSEYSLLICRECKYAIQKTALESHLLRHKIYRGERQQLLASIAELDLLEPEEVPLPVLGLPPIEPLPVLSGFRCAVAGCGHLAGSSKRMKRHWSEHHGNGTILPSSDSFAVPTSLQTFFRGTKIRYFEVATPSVLPTCSADHGSRDDSFQQATEPEHHPSASWAAPATSRHSPSLDLAVNGCSVDINLETLTYFHHFITITLLTLPTAGYTGSISASWHDYVVSQALKRSYLMCGLLALSANHLALLTDDAVTKSAHLRQEAQFCSGFRAGMTDITARASVSVSVGAGGESSAAEWIRSLLCCARLARDQPILEQDMLAPNGLSMIVDNIRGCIVPSSLPSDSSVMSLSHGHEDNRLISNTQRSKDHSDRSNSQMGLHSSTTPPTGLVDHLRALPHHIAEGLRRPDNGEDVFATLSAINSILQCVEISFTSDELKPAWLGVAKWLVDISDHFSLMISQHHHAALVVLAHWAAVLVKRAEHAGCWFVKGSAKLIVLRIVEQLSAEGCTILQLVLNLTDTVGD